MRSSRIDRRTGSWVVALALASMGSFVFGGSPDVFKALTNKGAIFLETKGVVTKVSVKDCSVWTKDDFKQLGTLKHVNTLGFGFGLADDGLAELTGLGQLESLMTNGMSLTDDAMKSLTRFPKLRNVAFFHPPKHFTGKGLAQLAVLPDLESLTVAGSYSFGDEGMAAIGKLTQLKGLRTWHAGWSDEGVKELKHLPNLKSLFLGQRLSYTGPASPSDHTIEILATFRALESLQLEEARLSLTALRKLRQLPKLKKLTLGGVDLTRTDLERLQAELAGVEVKWTPPSDAGQKRIKALFDGK